MNSIRIWTAALLLAASGAVRAATFLVNSPMDAGTGSLRTALAGLTAGSDHIVVFNLPANSTINLQSALPPLRGNSVFLDGFGAPGLTVNSVNGTRVFSIDSASPTQSVTLRLFRVTGGRADLGGCFYDPIQPVRSATIILDRMIFQGCQATAASDNRGGAVFAGTGLIVQDSEFLNNAAVNTAGSNASFNSGGAIYAFGTLSVSGSRFVGNEARANAPAVSASGAAIQSSNTATIARSHFSGNRVIGGQGVAYGTVLCSGSSSCTVANSSFQGNENIALATFAGNVSIDNTSFADNTAGSSLFVFPRTGQTRLRNLSFLRRIATTNNIASHLTMQFVSGESPDIAIYNTLFGPTGGSAPACGFSQGIAASGGGYNLSVDTSCNLFAGTTSLVIPGGLGMLDPVVLPGSTPAQVIALDGASPALDVGSPGIPNIHVDACRPGDARGALRPEDGDGDGTPVCDIGAYEAANPRIFSNSFEN
jgi:hypothetical protein